MEGSWSWEELTNSTDLVSSSHVCEEVTNHWLYFIFSGYFFKQMVSIDR